MEFRGSYEATWEVLDTSNVVSFELETDRPYLHYDSLKETDVVPLQGRAMRGDIGRIKIEL